VFVITREGISVIIQDLHLRNMAAVSGMAASIRSATENDVFDLAGHDAVNIIQTIKDAFSTPFALPNMIRITFIVGAGKLSRQKYDDKAMLTLTQTLKMLDYVEDRGASCVNECGGCYKTQHDTGKNLFTVVVFPRLAGQQNDDDDDGCGGVTAAASSSEYSIPIPLVEGTAVHTILLATEDYFQRMSPSICPSWSEKKMCSDVLNLAVETVQAMDAKLISGLPLTDHENSFYDAVGGVESIRIKIEFLKKLIIEQVESGALTQSELNRLLQQVDEKISSLNVDIDTAMQNSQEKKASKLTIQKENAESRKRMLKSHKGKVPHALKHEAQIMKLRKQLHPLLKLEKETKGKLLSIKETKELAMKDELLEEISKLEESSRGWFEEDDTFEVRLGACRKKQLMPATSSKATPTGSGGKGRTSGTGSQTMIKTTAWLTPGNALEKKAAVAGKSKSKTNGSVFAAMMIDSDSDSD